MPVPTRSGYTFNGWYTASSGGTKVTNATWVPSGNTTYYAQWTVNVPAPVIGTVKPANGSKFVQSSSTTISAEGTNVSRWEVWLGGSLKLSHTGSSFSESYTFNDIGTFTVEIKAFNSNNVSTSKFITIYVRDPATATYSITMNHYYDYGFWVRSGSSDSISQDYIRDRRNVLKTSVNNHLNINLIHNTPTKWQSYADMCHGSTSNVDGTAIDQACKHTIPYCLFDFQCSDHHHKHSGALANWFSGYANNNSSSNKNVLWSGHKSCATSKSAWAVNGKNIMIPYDPWIKNGTALANAVMLHEGGHILGAAGDAFCPYSNDKLFARPCIMAKNKSDAIEKALVDNSATINPYCEKCSSEIREHIRQYLD